MPAPKKKKPAKRRAAAKPSPIHNPVKKKPPAEPIRDHGDVVTAPAGTTEGQVVANLAGFDKLPPIGQELGRAPKAPPFDPHAGHEVSPGREFGGEAEPMITTMVFMGVDRGGDFEDRVQSIVNEAEKVGLEYVTATIGTLDLDKHVELIADLAEEVLPADTIDTDDDGFLGEADEDDDLDEEKF